MTDSSKALAGRTAIVTGSGQNIGRAIARRLAAAGAALSAAPPRTKLVTALPFTPESDALTAAAMSAALAPTL